MANPINTGRSTTTGDLHPPPVDKEKKLDRVAEDAAKKASETQKRYDTEHNVISK